MWKKTFYFIVLPGGLLYGVLYLFFPESLASGVKILSRLDPTNLTRAFKNNNPGNLRYDTSNEWMGQTGSQDGFCIFDTVLNGIRAMGITAKNYQKIYGINTLRAFGDRWAPISDNPDSEAGDYGMSLADHLRCNADASFDLSIGVPFSLADLCYAIAENESGSVLVRSVWNKNLFIQGVETI